MYIYFFNLKINELKSQPRILKNSKINLRMLKGDNYSDNTLIKQKIYSGKDQ